jgi:membrane fusion protein (multidrug efflux system)
VQRVPVRIELDPEQPAQHPLRLVMSMSVDVSIRDQHGAVLPVTVASKPLLTTRA